MSKRVQIYDAENDRWIWAKIRARNANYDAQRVKMRHLIPLGGYEPMCGYKFRAKELRMVSWRRY